MVLTKLKASDSYAVAINLEANSILFSDFYVASILVSTPHNSVAGLWARPRSRHAQLNRRNLTATKLRHIAETLNTFKKGGYHG